MLDQPEFEPEFYEKQIKMMEDRYSKLFKKWHLSWAKYYNYVTHSLRHKNYWIWVYFCGFEKFVQEQGDEEKGRHARLYKDADERIRRIIGDYFKIQEYVKSL
jgi:hypothetical protein